MSDNTEKTIEERIEELRKHVDLRDQMGGALYWNVLNDECCKMANELLNDGADKKLLSEVLRKGTHVTSLPL